MENIKQKYTITISKNDGTVIERNYFWDEEDTVDLEKLGEVVQDIINTLNN